MPQKTVTVIGEKDSNASTQNIPCNILRYPFSCIESGALHTFRRTSKNNLVDLQTTRQKF